MVEDKRVICTSDAVEEGGRGVRFEVDKQGETLSAFVVRYEGVAHAYINQCAHVPVELDWMEGEFFDDSGVYLVCSTHGALYSPETGVCVGGPCSGEKLQAIPVEEGNGQICLGENAKDIKIVSG